MKDNIKIDLRGIRWDDVTGFWISRGSSGRILWTEQWTFRSQERWAISWLT